MAPRGTIVYVHGASDRAPGVADHVARIEQQLEQAGMAFDVLPSRWGEAAGADLSRIELSLPSPHEPVLLEPPPPAVAPLAELAALARPAAAVSQPLATSQPRRQSDELLDICQTQVGAPDESISLADGGSVPLATACRNAALVVAQSSEYASARSSAVADRALVDAVGRAVVSGVAAPAAAPADVAQLAQVRIAEALLSAAISALLVGYLGIDIGPDLKRWATDVLLPHRTRLMREAALGPADIVLYQRAGEQIRGHVAHTVREAIERGGPVVALGNSLGGIILVDLLSAEGAPRPDLLVTTGSQAPLLATFGALAPLGEASSRAPFQPWLNIYDRRDLLGFVAQPVWPEAKGITDHEVDLGVGFPDSHGASYLSHHEVFRAIREHPALNSDSPAVARFRIDATALSWPARFVLGVSQRSPYIEINGGLGVRFGRVAAMTPLSNVRGWETVELGGANTLLGFVSGLTQGTLRLGSLGRGISAHLLQPLRLGPFVIRAVQAVTDATAVGDALMSRGVAQLG